MRFNRFVVINGTIYIYVKTYSEIISIGKNANKYEAAAIAKFEKFIDHNFPACVEVIYN